MNTALGINYFKKARFAEAEKLFRKALERLTDKYTTPKDGEAIYYLGLTLKAQGKTDEAFDDFYKATWSLAWRAAGYYSLAEIAATRGDMAAALDFGGPLARGQRAEHPGAEPESRRAAPPGTAQGGALQCWQRLAHKTDPLDVRVHGGTLAGDRKPRGREGAGLDDERASGHGRRRPPPST